MQGKVQQGIAQHSKASHNKAKQGMARHSKDITRWDELDNLSSS